MSKAVNSPTARLLQSSRLFSLPRPLPSQSFSALESSGQYRASPTATEPYPAYQAITTPSSSLSRGDWGLKRPLPASKRKKRSTDVSSPLVLRGKEYTSTPHIRVRAQDTYEHITDFASAGDHTQTYAKWQELGVPMIQASSRSKVMEVKKTPVSVYEEWVDNTDPNAPPVTQPSTGSGMMGRRVSQQDEAVRATERWKYTGPWIGGMQEGEFEKWMQHTISSKQGAWQRFMRKRETEARVNRARETAQQEGNALDATAISSLRTTLQPTDAELEEVSKQLRSDHASDGLSSRLTKLLCDFLDLPSIYVGDSPPQLSENQKLMNVMSSSLLSDGDGSDLSTGAGPPSTHPGAGLSYLRSNAVMTNHPLYGPQVSPAPVIARVVRPRENSGQRQVYQAKLGVAGVVAEDPRSATGSSRRSSRPRVADGGFIGKLGDADSMSSMLDPAAEGGNKVYVHPEASYVDERGRVRLVVDRAEREAIAVHEGREREIEELRSGMAQRRAQQQSLQGPDGLNGSGRGRSRGDPKNPWGVQSTPRVQGLEGSEAEDMRRILMERQEQDQ